MDKKRFGPEIESAQMHVDFVQAAAELSSRWFKSNISH